MIRLRRESYPPVYQLDLALRILRTGNDDLALQILKAQPLYPTKTIELTHVNNYAMTYYRVEDLHPIRVPTVEDRSVKVLYADAKYTREEAQKMWSGMYDDSSLYDWMHIFDSIGNYHLFTFDDEGAALMWYDIVSQETYISESTLILNTGSKVS